MGRCRKIPAFGPSQPPQQILNPDTNVSGRTNGFGLCLYPVPDARPSSDTVSYICFPAVLQAAFSEEIVRPVVFLKVDRHSGRRLPGIGSVPSQNL
jgi:hypothetical protein